jgi:predicted nucleic acid-binding protein
MRGTLVDSNVLLDVLSEDVRWSAWSSRSLADAAEIGPLWINPIIFAEVSVRFRRVEDVDAVLPPGDFGRSPIPWEAAFLAGKIFVQYRRRRGTRPSTLPDFFIGAHAAVTGLRLLTRDPRRYRTYFPSLEIHSP